MTGKKVENSMKIRVYIKARSLLCFKPVDIHREVCDIYGEGQMSNRCVCRWVSKLMAGEKDLTDAARSGRPRTTGLPQKVTLKNYQFTYSGCSIRRKGSGTISKLFFSTSSWHFKKTPGTWKSKCSMDTTFVNR